MAVEVKENNAKGQDMLQDKQKIERETFPTRDPKGHFIKQPPPTATERSTRPILKRLKGAMPAIFPWGRMKPRESTSKRARGMRAVKRVKDHAVNMANNPKRHAESNLLDDSMTTETLFGKG